MTEPASRTPTADLRFAALAFLAVVVSAASFVVIERLGAPGRALIVAALVLTLLLGAAGGVASGAMRMAVFLTQGRVLPAASLSLATAVTTLFALPGAPVLGLAGGLLLSAFLLGPALRRSGAPTWASFLGARFASPLLQALAAVALAAVALVLGAAALAHVALVLARALELTPAQAAALAAAVAACGAAPGGARSQTRAAVALGLVVVAGAAALWFARAAGTPERMQALLAPLGAPGGLALGVAAALAGLAPPAAQTIWPGLDRPRDMRIGLLWAAVLTVAIAFGVGPSASAQDGRFAELAFLALTTAGGLAAAGALLLAAGESLAFDLRARADRRWTPVSRRFAWLRAATLAAVAGAGWAAGAYPTQAMGLVAPAAALGVGAVVPPLLLGAGWSRANAPGAITAFCVGLVAALALIGGRMGPPDLDASAAGLLACAVALAAGAAASLFTRRSAHTPRPLADDAF